MDSGQWAAEKAIVVGHVTVPAPMETAVLLPPEVSVERARFVIGQWCGIPTWRCTFCPFETLDGESAIVEHWQIEHGSWKAAASDHH